MREEKTAPVVSEYEDLCQALQSALRVAEQVFVYNDDLLYTPAGVVQCAEAYGKLRIALESRGIVAVYENEDSYV